MQQPTNYRSATRGLPVSIRQDDHKREVAEQLAHEVGEARDVLFRARTVFPMTIFPDVVTIDRTKMTVTHKEFFKVGEVQTLRIEDILNVTATVGPIFGTIKVTTRFFDQAEPYMVRYLWRSDALRIKRIMQGYIIAMQKQIDCSALSSKELAATLDKLGAVAPAEKI